MSEKPFFSVVIPTRNRVDMFRQALDSVIAQSFTAREIIVVNDGSTGEDLTRYRSLEADYPNVKFIYLVHRPNGHGQSYSMNVGASQALGEYLCFLDDDDYWTDREHLSRAFQSLTAAETPVDLYITNQHAHFSNGERKEKNPWVGDLVEKVANEISDQHGSVRVKTGFLLGSSGFAHLNCSIYRRNFYSDIGGMDENIRYECDRDIYLRALDRASCIYFNPVFVSYHRIPDVKTGSNMSTVISDLQKRLYQLMVYEKNILFATTCVVRKFCFRGKGYQLKRISETLLESGKFSPSARYAWQALSVMPGLKWALFTLAISVRALFSKE